jgi:hypothetical protein
MSSLSKDNTLSNAPTLEDFQKMRQFLDNNPDFLKPTTRGRKKGAKLVEEGNILEVTEPLTPEVTVDEAKNIIKKGRKPRVLSEETKAKMTEVLARGREVLKQKRAEEKAQKEAVPPGPKVVKTNKVPKGYEGETIVKKYIIKPKEKPAPKKKIYVDEDEETDYPTSESEMSDTTLINKIKKKTRAIKKIDNILLTAPPTVPMRRDPFRR